jgi:hypothetical protein
VYAGPLGQDDLAARVTQRLSPLDRVRIEERLKRASDQIRTGTGRAGCRRSITGSGRGTEDGAIAVRTPNAQRERLNLWASGHVDANYGARAATVRARPAWRGWIA